MHLAVWYNHPEIVRKLIEKGITGPENLNQTFKGPKGDSLLHYAIRKGYTEVALALIEAGADLKAIDDKRKILDLFNLSKGDNITYCIDLIKLNLKDLFSKLNEIKTENDPLYKIIEKIIFVKILSTVKADRYLKFKKSLPPAPKGDYSILTVTKKHLSCSLYGSLENFVQSLEQAKYSRISLTALPHSRKEAFIACEKLQIMLQHIAFYFQQWEPEQIREKVQLLNEAAQYCFIRWTEEIEQLYLECLLKTKQEFDDPDLSLLDRELQAFRSKIFSQVGESRFSQFFKSLDVHYQKAVSRLSYELGILETFTDNSDPYTPMTEKTRQEFKTEFFKLYNPRSILLYLQQRIEKDSQLKAYFLNKLFNLGQRKSEDLKKPENLEFIAQKLDLLSSDDTPEVKEAVLKMVAKYSEDVLLTEGLYGKITLEELLNVLVKENILS
jgi:hypothetical protein